MEVKITGGRELIELAKKFNQTSKLMAGFSRSMAEETVDLVKDGFDKESDPYGKKWKATARGGEILSDTGALKGGIKVKSATKSKFVITASVDYASVHQGGMTIRAKTAKGMRFKIGGKWVSVKEVTIPARPFFPDGKMPSAWMDVFEEKAETMLKEHFG
jgi:phage gpG-like protein